jgi:tRNA U34 5-carboxymethylaminomethyl modifying GTPase MnmE/TrmE
MIAVSAKDGFGLSDLVSRLSAISAERIGAREEPAITQVRHRQLIEQCAESLSAFLHGSAGQVELRAEDLRRAATALGRITGRVEQEGIKRSFAAARDADLVIWLMDAHEPEATPPAEIAALAERTLYVLNKVDLLPGDAATTMPDDMIAISAKDGFGLSDLVGRLSAIAAGRIGSREEPAITQVRHRQLIETCAESLGAFLHGSQKQVELRAEDLRRAASALGRVTGRVDVEDVLDQIFARFCVGK